MGKNIQKLINNYIKSSDQAALDELKGLDYFKVALGALKRESRTRRSAVVKLLAQDGRDEAKSALESAAKEAGLPLSVRLEAYNTLTGLDPAKADDALAGNLNKLMAASKGEGSDDTLALYQGLSPAEREAFVHETVEARNSGLVGFLLDKCSDKSDLKLLNKAANNLKAAGEKVEIASKDSDQFQLKTSLDAKNMAKISYMGMQGFCACVLSFSESMKQPANFMVHFVYPDSIVHISKAREGRKGFKEVVGMLEGRFGHNLVEVPDDLAAALIMRCASESRKNDVEIPSGWLSLNSHLQKITPQEDIFDGLEELLGLKDEPLENNLAARAGELLDVPIIKFAWIPPEKVMEACMERLRETEAGKLVIDDKQKMEQFHKAHEASARECLEEVGRENMVLRMEVTAMLLGLEGKKELARIALATANDMKDAERPEFLVDIFRAWFKIEKQAGADGHEEQPSSTIIQPGSAASKRIVLPGEE